MAKLTKASIYMFAALSSVALLAGCGKEPATQAVSFAKDIVPILSKHCYECHLPGGQGEQASGLNMSSYATLMKGTKFGPIIKAGDAASSTLSILVEGRADPSINMPHGGRPPLSKQETDTIRQWITQGAKNN
jgi:hypothetical protein